MKNTIKNIYDWIVRNFSNIFSVVGIILTFYLSVFYAPRWIRDNENERIANAKKSLKESIKELAYSDSSFTFKDVAILYQATRKRDK